MFGELPAGVSPESKDVALHNRSIHPLREARVNYVEDLDATYGGIRTGPPNYVPEH